MLVLVGRSKNIVSPTPLWALDNTPGANNVERWGGEEGGGESDAARQQQDNSGCVCRCAVEHPTSSVENRKRTSTLRQFLREFRPLALPRASGTTFAKSHQRAACPPNPSRKGENNPRGASSKQWHGAALCGGRGIARNTTRHDTQVLHGNHKMTKRQADAFATLRRDFASTRRGVRGTYWHFTGEPGVGWRNSNVAKPSTSMGHKPRRLTMHTRT